MFSYDPFRIKTARKTHTFALLQKEYIHNKQLVSNFLPILGTIITLMFFLGHVPSFRISLLLLHSLFSYVLLIYNSIILSQKKFRNTSIISIFCIALLMVTYYHFDILFWYIFIAAYRLNDCRTRRINVALPWNIYFHVVWSIWTTNWSPYCNIHVLRWTLRLRFWVLQPLFVILQSIILRNLF